MIRDVVVCVAEFRVWILRYVRHGVYENRTPFVLSAALCNLAHVRHGGDYVVGIKMQALDRLSIYSAAKFCHCKRRRLLSSQNMFTV